LREKANGRKKIDRIQDCSQVEVAFESRVTPRNGLQVLICNHVTTIHEKALPCLKCGCVDAADPWAYWIRMHHKMSMHALSGTDRANIKSEHDVSAT